MSAIGGKADIVVCPLMTLMRHEEQHVRGEDGR
jgi:hypothetical protein